MLDKQTKKTTTRSREAKNPVEDFIRFTGCGGAVAENDDHTEFCAENASKEFKVKIDVVKVYLNFANR